MKTKKLLIILFVLIFLIMLFGFVACEKRDDGSYFIKNDVPVSIKLDDSQTNVNYENENKVYHPDITLPGWGELTVKANVQDISQCINIYNPTSNVYFNCPKCKGLLDELYCKYCDHSFEFKEVDQNVYYLKFSIFLKDTGEVLYSSDLVKPGYHIKNVSLNRALEVGDYDISILIEPYKTDMATKCNSGEINTILHVTDTI